ncbi:hypothetical protein N752_19990 [Desulforamulus aquiferis]|nr:hypothetical protein [Desulforamulus aquiferis]RYD03463.1 hypothetical protein N752_19990 [Desulforamulus aquiferis]
MREAEKAMGSTKINDSERKYLKDSLRVVAKHDIEKGEIISLNKTVNKRCSSEKSLMPLEFKEISPSIARDKIKKDQQLFPKYWNILELLLQ